MMSITKYLISFTLLLFVILPSHECVKRNSNLSPMGIMGEKTDSYERCTVNLGPCEPRCDERCCHKTCEDYYSQRYPEAACSVGSRVGVGFRVKIRFSPEALGVQFTTGLLCWLLQILLKPYYTL
ncbi:hypothetical protein RDI58_017043 [Solanum bulbocastanum]|uniref:Uncharacterized protein n=1 Tax=Solanum bulbocastanum TaxID=147425 RepID=A0AAN8TBK0_SOLBU